MRNRSRLSRKLEKQTKNNLYLSIFGIIALLFVLFKFGIPLLVNFSVLISDSKGSQNPSNEKSNSYVAIPVLNPIPEATNSAKTDISGIGSAKQTISLEINGKIVDKISTKDNGSFNFSDIDLSNGENSIRVKATTGDNKDSSFTQAVTINYINSAPKLDINSPSDGQKFSKDDKNLNVTGKTDPGIKVTVNGFWAIVDDNGNFSYSLPLQNGDNQIKIIAVDDAGNKTETEKKVTYSP